MTQTHRRPYALMVCCEKHIQYDIIRLLMVPVQEIILTKRDRQTDKSMWENLCEEVFFVYLLIQIR